MRSTNIRATALAWAILTVGCPGARAELLAYDGFDYPSGGPLLARNGGSGFSSPWFPGGHNASIFQNFTVGDSSPGFGPLATSAGCVSASSADALAGLARALPPGLGVPGTTAYVSVLVRPNSPASGGKFNNFFGLNLVSSLGNDVFVGRPGGGSIGHYVVEGRGGDRQRDSGVAAVEGRTVLLVLRVDFGPGVDRFTLHVNPAPGGDEPTTGTVKRDTDIGNVIGLNIYATGAFTLDEIRVGTTFADVVPVTPAADPRDSRPRPGPFEFRRRDDRPRPTRPPDRPSGDSSPELPRESFPD